jgi:hypothetical protein
MLPRQTAQVNALIARLISETEQQPGGVVNIFTGGYATADDLGRAELPSVSNKRRQ